MHLPFQGKGYHTVKAWLASKSHEMVGDAAPRDRMCQAIRHIQTDKFGRIYFTRCNSFNIKRTGAEAREGIARDYCKKHQTQLEAGKFTKVTGRDCKVFLTMFNFDEVIHSFGGCLGHRSDLIKIIDPDSAAMWMKKLKEEKKKAPKKKLVVKKTAKEQISVSKIGTDEYDLESNARRIVRNKKDNAKLRREIETQLFTPLEKKEGLNKCTVAKPKQIRMLKKDTLKEQLAKQEKILEEVRKEWFALCDARHRMKESNDWALKTCSCATCYPKSGLGGGSYKTCEHWQKV